MKKQKFNNKRKIPPPQGRPKESGVSDAARVTHSMEPNSQDGEGG